MNTGQEEWKWSINSKGFYKLLVDKVSIALVLSISVQLFNFRPLLIIHKFRKVL